MSCNDSCASVQLPDELTFFGPGATSAFSGNFAVGERPLILTADGLEPGWCVVVDQVFGCGAGNTFVSYRGGCDEVRMCATSNTVLIPDSGRYRLRLIGGAEENPEDVTVYGRQQLVPPGYGGSSMSCTCGPVADWTVNHGGTIINGTFTNSQFVGGTISGSQLSGVQLGISCGGLPVMSGAALATCADLAAIQIPSSLPPSGPAGGDLSGTYPNPTLRPGAALGKSCSGSDVRIGDVDFVKCPDLTYAVAQAVNDANDHSDAADAVQNANITALAAQVAAKQGQLKDCTGAPLPAGASVPTCAQMAAALAGAAVTGIDITNTFGVRIGAILA